MQDLQDGSYKVSFVIFEAGRYEIKIRLENTLCDGFKDPPLDWMIKSRKFNFCGRDVRFEDLTCNKFCKILSKNSKKFSKI